MQETTRKQVACLSDIGHKRKNNEDAAYVVSSKDGTFLIVCDGMGGHRKGEVASKLIVDSLAIPYTTLKKKPNVKGAKKFVHKYLKKANKEIYKMSLEGGELKEMGSTVVCALICPDGTYIISLGDSRCYTYALTTGLVHRTTDQTYVELLFEAGKISRSEMDTHPQKNILINAVGIMPELSQIQECVVDNNSYDTLLLCSDGLYNMVSDAEIVDVLSNTTLSVNEKAKALIDLALSHGGNDNVAVALWEREL